MKAVYVGSMEKIAEYIYFNEGMSLSGIICEAGKLSDRLYTYSVVRDVPLYTVSSHMDMQEATEKIGGDVSYIMCSYGKRVPIEKLKGQQWYNIHYAGLPNYKGRHPTYWATVSGEKRIGVTLHTVTERFDEGRIISQKYVDYYFWENEISLFDKLTEKVPDLLKDLACYMKNGKTCGRANNREGYYPPVSRRQVTLDLGVDSPQTIYNKVRSQARAGGAEVAAGGKVFRLYGMLLSPEGCDGPYKIAEGRLYIRYRQGQTIISDYFEELE